MVFRCHAVFKVETGFPDQKTERQTKDCTINCVFIYKNRLIIISYNLPLE